MKISEEVRKQAKTPEQRFINMLEEEFRFAPKIAQAILAEAQECLGGQAEHVRPGQIRVLLVKRDAPHGQALSSLPQVEVTWTVDAGAADGEVAERAGRLGLRRVRIQRLLDEALLQGAVASQEDLARALQTSVRTIKRDCEALAAQGVVVPTRGKLKGIGRGQTHKAQIVGGWLGGETYDQLARRTHHSLTCVRRYIDVFVRVIDLHRQAFAAEEISLLLQLSVPLVHEYLAVYAKHDGAFARQRLADQLDRMTQGQGRSKKGAR